MDRFRSVLAQHGRIRSREGLARQCPQLGGRGLGVHKLGRVVDVYQDLLLDLLSLGVKPTVKIVAAGARIAFACESDKAKMFGERMTAALSYCRVKKKSMSSGKNSASQSGASLRPCARSPSGRRILCGGAHEPEQRGCQTQATQRRPYQ